NKDKGDGGHHDQTMAAEVSQAPEDAGEEGLAGDLDSRWGGDKLGRSEGRHRHDRRAGTEAGGEGPGVIHLTEDASHPPCDVQPPEDYWRHQGTEHGEKRTETERQGEGMTAPLFGETPPQNLPLKRVRRTERAAEHRGVENHGGDYPIGWEAHVEATGGGYQRLDEKSRRGQEQHGGDYPIGWKAHVEATGECYERLDEKARRGQEQRGGHGCPGAGRGGIAADQHRPEHADGGKIPRDQDGQRRRRKINGRGKIGD